MAYSIDGFDSVELTGDYDNFILEYIPAIKGEKLQKIILDANNEDEALREAAHILGVDKKCLRVEWL